jgi:hypothetical protein
MILSLRRWLLGRSLFTLPKSLFTDCLITDWRCFLHCGSTSPPKLGVMLAIANVSADLLLLSKNRFILINGLKVFGVIWVYRRSTGQQIGQYSEIGRTVHVIEINWSDWSKSRRVIVVMTTAQIKWVLDSQINKASLDQKYQEILGVKA